MATTEIPHYDPYAREWQTLTVEVPDAPRRRRTRKRSAPRRGPACTPLDHSGSAPVPPYWVGTAFTETGPLADMRTYVKAPAIRTHRAAVTLPADPGRITVTR